MLPFTVKRAGRHHRRHDDLHERRRGEQARGDRLDLVSQGACSARRSTRSASCCCCTHAFETLSCIAVEFRTHFFNQQSRAAIARLGAKQDGVLRNHQLSPDGAKRDTVVFSIIACGVADGEGAPRLSAGAGPVALRRSRRGRRRCEWSDRRSPRARPRSGPAARA